MSGTGEDDGFSLIEALVALAVLAIATVGLIGAVEQHIDSTRGMERRAAAMWVAENRLAELSLGGGAIGGRDVAMLGETWRVEAGERATDDPDIARVEVRVYPGGEKTPMATLQGFIDVSEAGARRS